ncbi:MAG: hypothetical protein IKL55_06695 [Clostridia bacterium]|nr:hypothetical protein [Clostridia bacterium]
MEELERGNLNSLPMDAYEYHCCVEYLKKIRYELCKNWKNFETITLFFGETDYFDLLIVPLEDCLKMVASEVGFELIGERVEDEMYKYTLKSMFAEGR